MGQRGALLGPSAVYQVMFDRLTPHLVLLLDGQPIPPNLAIAHAAFSKAGYKTIPNKIARIETKDRSPPTVNAHTLPEMIVHFEDAAQSPITLDFIAYGPPSRQHIDTTRGISLAAQLGLTISSQGNIVVREGSMFGETTVEGVFVGGDATVIAKAVNIAMSTGAMASAGVAHMIQFKKFGMEVPFH